MPLIPGPGAVIDARVAVGLVYDVPVVQGAAGLDAGSCYTWPVQELSFVARYPKRLIAHSLYIGCVSGFAPSTFARARDHHAYRIVIGVAAASCIAEGLRTLLLGRGRLHGRACPASGPAQVVISGYPDIFGASRTHDHCDPHLPPYATSALTPSTVTAQTTSQTTFIRPDCTASASARAAARPMTTRCCARFWARW